LRIFAAAGMLCCAVLWMQCMESQYINSRPFRVNAGAVHAYVQAPGGKTAYLSELRSGSEVLVADAAGRTRTAVVGRCKVEVRPMVRDLRDCDCGLNARHPGGAADACLFLGQNGPAVFCIMQPPIFIPFVLPCRC
jgi:hypothetical protein